MADDDRPIRHYSTERLILFSDAVIAITITLLVLELRLPEGFGEFSDGELWGALGALSPRILAYLVSFGVIGVFWINHHAKFASIEHADGALLWINLLFLLTIGLVPFTTSIIAENSGAVGTTLYAGTMVATGLTLAWISHHADRKGLVDPAMPKERRQREFIASVLTSAVFAISVPLSFAHPDGAKLVWLLLIPVNLIARWGVRFLRKP